MIDLSGKCFFCEQPVGEEGYCYGCGFSICNSCDFGQPVGMHKPNDHLVNEDGKTYNEVINGQQ